MILGILPGESYSGIRALADLSVCGIRALADLSVCVKIYQQYASCVRAIGEKHRAKLLMIIAK